MQTYLYDRAEYARPWKLATLAIGIAFLIAGAVLSGLPDWDVPISLIMALPAYLTAPCSWRVMLERRWNQAHLALFWTWFSVDGTYTIYWFLRDSSVLEEGLRHANAGVSLALYGICGLLWYPKASLRDAIKVVVKSDAATCQTKCE